METKPIVTCHGNQVLFSSLHPTVVQGLPKEPSEWRRSYGRPPRNVYLEASFVPYDDDILPDDTDKTLISRPYFHIYWTDCDLETYKNSVKEEITDWSTALKNKNIPDWLIVVVNNEENKIKNKLLPRSSVYDKIKSDFCSKYSDRCLVLTDPQKSDGKSLESWNTFLARLRQLLLQAFSRHLQKYEDNMRALREKRNELGWNFHEYFIVQEELAFMFEMLGLFDDALIQYDELDALFTQFVLNHASGEAVQWLKSLIEPCSSWAGLSLHKPIDWDKRNHIKDNATSLLDFRNYLFARQCALLILLKRPAELILRALDFLHNTVQEIKALEIEIPQGGLDCWVFLSGLEVLRKCEKLTDSSQARALALNTANLWDYVCRKLQKLGELCGLMPGMTQHPSSDQLQLVIDLTAGMGLKASQPSDYEDEDQTISLPRDKLREALSSRESFQKIYLEQSELAMGTFKHIGRFRSARMIGKNLADFYMKLGEPHKAENYLLDAMKMYRDEGWKFLTDMSRLDLARCQHEVGDHIKYLKTACRVVASQVVDMPDRQYHMEEILKIAKTEQELPVLLKASPLLHIEVTNIDHDKVMLDELFKVEIKIVNQSPNDLSCESVWLSLADYTPSSAKIKRPDSVKIPVSRQSSEPLLDKRIVMNKKPVRKRIPSVISLQAHYEMSQSAVDSAGIACVNTNEILKRLDSSHSDMGILEEENIFKDTMSTVVSLDNVKLKKGENILHFTSKSPVAGCFKPGQFGAKLLNLEFLKDLQTDLFVTVGSEDCSVEIKPDSLIAGILQEVTVKLHTGSSAIEAGYKVTVVPSTGLQVDNMAESGSSLGNTVLLEQSERGATVEWKMTLLQQTSATGGDRIEDKIAFDCSWLPRPLLTTVTFLNPFHLSHRIHTARDMKYVQVLIHGNSEIEFEISDWTLAATNTKDVELQRLNKPGQVLKVNTEQSCSCMWQVKSNIPEFPPLDLTFTMEYSCLSGLDHNKRSLPYSFNIENYQTLYNVKVEVKPKGDNKVCLTGSLVKMILKVVPQLACKLPADQELMYQINTDQSMWGVHGKSAGVFTMPEDGYSVELDMLPLMTGFLPLPRVKLLKYYAKKTNKVTDNLQEVDLYDFLKEIDSTDDESDREESKATPNEIEFSQGQVYYSSLGKQVHVYPENVGGDVEVTIM